MPSGLQAVGYSSQDIPNLVKGALPQKRVLNNAPRHVGAPELEKLYSRAMSYW